MYYIHKNVFDKIYYTLGNAPIESGGIIGCRGNTICAYYFDWDNTSVDSEYTPQVKKMNKVIKNWAKVGVEFMGIVHSHPNGYNKPSLGDAVYAKSLMGANKFLTRLIFPIVTKEDGQIKITFYEFIENFIPIEVTCIENNND